MKGIILAGGLGTRLYPITKVISKHLLPIYDKPMIYYPLSILMLSGIREILIICTNRDLNLYKELLGNGSNLGISISYKIQKKPKGIADAFLVGKNFIKNSPVALILGDNILYSKNLSEILQKAIKENEGATIFGYKVKNPTQFGVVEFDDNMNVVSLEEKPTNPKSEYAIPGLYFYNNKVVDIAKNLNPSPRGELEITDVNKIYMNDYKLKVKILEENVTWFDTGSYDGLLRASYYIKTYQEENGIYIGNIEKNASSSIKKRKE